MSELISGKEALIALANGEEVQIRFKSSQENGWFSVGTTEIQTVRKILTGGDEFRLKPRTITINGIEVPAPFKPKEGEDCCYLSDESIDGFHTISYNSARYAGMLFGLYRPSEIKQVVAALRSIFK